MFVYDLSVAYTILGLDIGMCVCSAYWGNRSIRTIKQSFCLNTLKGFIVLRGKNIPLIRDEYVQYINIVE